MDARERVDAPPPDGDISVDVAIVGAGLTGLWTAYYLALAEPQLRIAVLDRHHVGFGASGRNGGWCSGLLASSLTTLAERHGRPATIAMQAVMHDSVDEVGRVLAAEGVDADFTKGGTVTAARTPEQHGRLFQELLEARTFGLTTDDVRWLEPDEVQQRCAMSATRAALFTPHCAAVHPLRLVHGLARATQRRGVSIHGATPVLEQTAAGLVTPHGRVRADVVVWATEAWTTTRPGCRRDVVAAVLADDRHGAADGGAVGGHRLGRARDVPRRPPPDHLRPAHRRRAAGVRRARGAVPLRVAHRRAVRPVGRSARPARRRAPRAVPGARRRRRPVPLGRPARRAQRTGSGRWASTGRPARATPVATSATASRRRTSPGGRWPT